MFKVFQKRWKRAPIKPQKALTKEPQDVSSTGSDHFPNCDFDVEFRVGNEDISNDNDVGSFRKPMEQISLPESTFSDQPMGSPETSPGRSKKAKFPVSEMDLFTHFRDSEWLDAKRQLSRLKKHGNSQDICRILARRDGNDESILHIAAWKAPPGLFHFMVGMIPEADRRDFLSLEDKDGNTPFHLLCANLAVDCVDFSVVEHTLMLDIGILDQPNSYGDTCLDLLIASDAFSMSQPTEFDTEAAIEKLAVCILTNIGTETLSSCKNMKGLTLLHIAIANQVRAGVLSQLLRLLPSSSKDKDERGMLPLHYVAGSPLVPASFVEELIKVNPESITIQDKNRDTPLHLQIVNAGQRNGKLDRNMVQVTELLLGDKFKEQAREGENALSPMVIQNNDGLTPLHACAVFGPPSELTRMLMESPFADESAILKTETGATALHLFCESDHVRENVDVIRFLSSKKEVCSATDSEGRTPLFVAVVNTSVSADVVKVLCRAYPEGLTVVENGMNALHRALSMGPDANAAVVKALLKAAPEAINVAWKGNTVLSEASKRGVPTSVANVLVERSSSKDVKKSKRATRAVLTNPN